MSNHLCSQTLIPATWRPNYWSLQTCMDKKHSLVWIQIHIWRICAAVVHTVDGFTEGRVFVRNELLHFALRANEYGKQIHAFPPLAAKTALYF